jgi:hypothetical protein
MKRVGRTFALVAATASLLAVASPASAQSNAAAPAPPAAASANAPKMPPKACLDVLDRMSMDVPREESGPVLRSRGLRIRTPIIVPDGVITETKSASAVRVRVMIDSNGRVLPRTVEVQASEGDPALAGNIASAVERSLSFDTSGALTVPPQFPFTTVYVNCGSP